ncbi:hypothetical protein FZEAL_9107 [Fusarium zealandicum]|uniref:Ankyrin repeat protein n=1 Tax=Fusarium zealandicum TaxID=1053134 RepID=A0A8H4XH04_9HYPO|nr:hypothetical protein FZEAL_9107 [Fusarium zealandicum]
MTHHDDPEKILLKLKDAAERADTSALDQGLLEWERVREEDWANVEISDGFSVRHHGLSPKMRALHVPMNAAANHGHREVAARLLRKGCEVPVVSVRHVVHHKHWDLLQLFIDSGWDINSPLEGPKTNSSPIMRHVLASHRQMHLLTAPTEISSGTLNKLADA